MIERTILHYKILEELGRGGMGVVYKAEDTKLRRTVALKFLPHQLSSSEKDTARFVQEAQAASALNHPNVCTIHDIQEVETTGAPESVEGKQWFIVMEYIEGRTLRETLNAREVRGLSIQQAVEIAIQIADGLAAAHEKGIVHRDIKPENIMVRKDGIVQIMDFGVAKLRASSAGRLTEEGTTVGTAGYMSPEQIQGQEADHRSDIFSFGVLLFELLTGRLPFKGIHNAALAYEIVHVEAPIASTLRVEIQPELDQVVKECLQKDPAERYQSLAEAAKALRRIRRASDHVASGLLLPGAKGIPAASGSSPGHPRFLLPRWVLPLVLFFVAGGGIGLGLFLWKPWGTRDYSPPSVARFIVPLPKGCSLELRRDGLALSPDGRHLAFIVRQDSSARLFLRDLGEYEARPVGATAGLNVSGVFFSPDGRWLGFFANGKLMKLSLQGGSPVTICDAGAVGGQASWGEGGTIVFMKEWGSHLWIVSSDAGSTPRPLTRLDLDAGERAHLLPRILPGGKRALFTIWRGGSLNEDLLAVVDLNTGEYHTVITGGTGGTSISVGQMVYMLGSTLMGVPFDRERLKVTGDPSPVLEKVLMNGGDAFPYFAVSNNGTLVYAPGEVEFVPTMITLVEHGSAVRRIESGNANLSWPEYSPDGKSLSVVITGPAFQVGIFDLGRGVLTPLTFRGDNILQIWDPDGEHITFSSNVSGSYQIYTVASNGSSEPQQLFEQDGNPYPASWSPDGKRLAYVVATKETGSDIWLYSKGKVPSTRPLLSSHANEVAPMFSPDAHWLAYVSDESGANEVYVQPFPTLAGRWRVSDGGGTSPRWSPDGRRLLFQRNDELLSVAVSATDHESLMIGREERSLVRPGLMSFALAPNGKTMVIGQTASESQVDHLNIVLNWSEELKQKSGPGPVPAVK